MLSIGLFLVYDRYLSAQTTYLGGFNWYDEKITVIWENKELEVEPGDMFSMEVTKKGESIVSFLNSKGDVIRENRYLLDGRGGAILEILSPTKENQCLYQADVTNYYYKQDSGDTIRSIEKITETSVDSYFYRIENGANVQLVVPGLYIDDFLPDKIDVNKKVRGIFFVECSANEQDEIKADILGSLNYSETN